MAIQQCDEICLSFGFTENDIPEFFRFKTKELENIYSNIKNRLFEIEQQVSDLLYLEGIYKKAITEQQKKEARRINKELANLGDEVYYINRLRQNVHNCIIKRKRHSINNVSRLALNHGGVYSDGHMVQPRVGMGFRGYKGVTL